MTIDAKILERAVRRHWFRCPKDDGIPLALLETFTRNKIVAEALAMQTEDTCTQESQSKTVN